MTPQPDRPDYYVILGVEPSATIDEIRAAYRQRIRILHPDRFDQRADPIAWSEANLMMRELNEAFSVLSNADARHAYDTTHRSAIHKAQGGTTPPRPPGASDGDLTNEAEASGSDWHSVKVGLAGVFGVWIVFTLAVELGKGNLSGPRSSSSAQRAVPARTSPTSPTNSAAPGPRQRDRAPATVPSPTRSSEHVGCEAPFTPRELPANGTVWMLAGGEPLAPLEVRVKGDHHYLVKLERRGAAAAYLLIRPGSLAEMLVPLGEYTLKYATGTGEVWCGERSAFPFGMATSFFATNDIFRFRDVGDRYEGYTVELIVQPGGNLETRALRAELW